MFFSKSWLSSNKRLQFLDKHKFTGKFKENVIKNYFSWIMSEWIAELMPIIFSSVQFSSVAQSCPTLCDPMNHSTPGLHIHHRPREFTQTHVHRVGDAIQPSHPLLSPSPPALNPSQHQSLFQWVNSSHEVDKVLEFQLQKQSYQWTPRTGLLSVFILCYLLEASEPAPLNWCVVNWVHWDIDSS